MDGHIDIDRSQQSSLISEKQTEVDLDTWLAEALLVALNRGADSSGAEFHPGTIRKEGVFGAVVRARRVECGYGLRQFAQMIGISAAYLSQVERNEVPPPAEERVIAIAKALKQDPDVLIALTGRIPNILQLAILRFPTEMSVLVRSTLGLSKGEISEVARFAKTMVTEQG